MLSPSDDASEASSEAGDVPMEDIVNPFENWPPALVDFYQQREVILQQALGDDWENNYVGQQFMSATR